MGVAIFRVRAWPSASTRVAIHGLCLRTRGSMEQSSFEVESCVHGHHVYQSIWNPQLGQMPLCERELGNPKDPYAIAVLTVHTKNFQSSPQENIDCLFCASSKGGQITCVITASRRYSPDLTQGGLEVPCSLKFQGKQEELQKIKKLILLQKQKPEVCEPLAKKVKVEDTPTIADSTDKMWINYANITLNLIDKSKISSGGWLTDKHRFCPRNTCKHITELQSTLLFSNSDYCISLNSSRRYY